MIAYSGDFDGTYTPTRTTQPLRDHQPTRSQSGLSGDVFQPLNVTAAATRLFSYQTSYDALGAQCDPSYTLETMGAEGERGFIMGYVTTGFTVVMAEYEGEDNAYGTGQQSGYETLDGMRAAGKLLSVPLSELPEGAEDLRKLGWHRRIQLRVVAGVRTSVRSPAYERRGVPEAVSLKVVVGHFHHQFRPEWFPTQVLACAPTALAARDAARWRSFRQPGVVAIGFTSQGLEGLGELGPSGDAETGGHADMVEHVRLIEQAEEEGAHDVPGLVPPEASDYAVGRPLVLHLQHDPFVGEIVESTVLDHYAVEPGTFKAGKPVASHLRPRRHRGDVNGWSRCLESLLEGLPAYRIGLVRQVTIVQCQQVEGYEGRRCGAGE